MSGALQLPSPSPPVQGLDGVGEAHCGTCPNVKMKSSTPWLAAVLMVPSIFVQLKFPLVGSSIAQDATSQKRRVETGKEGNGVKPVDTSGLFDARCSIVIPKNWTGMGVEGSTGTSEFMSGLP